MKELLAWLGVAFGAFLLFLAASVTQDIARDAQCKNGVPRVVEGKVYRCVEQK